MLWRSEPFHLDAVASSEAISDKIDGVRGWLILGIGEATTKQYGHRVVLCNDVEHFGGRRPEHLIIEHLQPPGTQQVGLLVCRVSVHESGEVRVTLAEESDEVSHEVIVTDFVRVGNRWRRLPILRCGSAATGTSATSSPTSRPGAPAAQRSRTASAAASSVPFEPAGCSSGHQCTDAASGTTGRHTSGLFRSLLASTASGS